MARTVWIEPDRGCDFQPQPAPLRRRVSELLGRYEIDASPDSPVAALRPASRTMVAIARALSDGDGPGDAADDGLVLVLNEPTASLPEHEVQSLLDAICAVPRAVRRSC